MGLLLKFVNISIVMGFPTYPKTQAKICQICSDPGKAPILKHCARTQTLLGFLDPTTEDSFEDFNQHVEQLAPMQPLLLPVTLPLGIGRTGVVFRVGLQNGINKSPNYEGICCGNIQQQLTLKIIEGRCFACDSRFCSLATPKCARLQLQTM